MSQKDKQQAYYNGENLFDSFLKIGDIDKGYYCPDCGKPDVLKWIFAKKESEEDEEEDRTHECANCGWKGIIVEY